MKYVPSQPQAGALYQRLQTLVAMNHAGLGANNVGGNPYAGMIGQAFQKPLSRTVTELPPVADRNGW